MAANNTHIRQRLKILLDCRPFDGHALISAECASALLRHALENLNSLAAALSDLTYWPDTKSSANQYQDLWRLKPGLMVAQCTAGFLLQACQDVDFSALQSAFQAVPH